MELIKQIKQAEAQAQEIIEKARTDAVKQADEGRRKRQAAIDQAEQERRKAT
jgi:vacuolar-type H+-ATPase subunit H